MGGFGISARDDLLLVEDISLVKQRCTRVTVKFDDEAVADYFDQQVDQGRAPEQFGRIWMHTHPGSSNAPSGTDEATFARCFGSADWAIMFILARGGETYARLRFNTGPGGEIVLPVEVDYEQPFQGTEHAVWDREYGQSVTAEEMAVERRMRSFGPLNRSDDFREHPDMYLDDPYWNDPHTLLEALDERLGFPF